MPDFFSLEFFGKFGYQVFFGMIGLSFLVLIHEAGHFFVAKKV